MFRLHTEVRRYTEEPTLVGLKNNTVLIPTPQVLKLLKVNQGLGPRSKKSVALGSFVKTLDRFALMPSRSFQLSKKASKNHKGMFF